MFKSRAYRHPSEIPILILTFLLSVAVVVATAFMTQCLSFLLVLLILGAAVYTTYAMPTQLIRKAALASPEIQTRADFEQALDKIDAQSGAFLNKLMELLRSHPNMMKRVNALKAYAASPDYASLQAKVDSNL